MTQWATIIVLLFGLFLLHCESPTMLQAPTNLRTEYLPDPLGIDTDIPRFSWYVNDSTRGAIQSAYRMLVASREDLLREGEADLWDSGKQSSDQSVLVPYEGAPLESGRTYYWKVKTWDAQGEATDYSNTAHWEMGLLDESDWQAQWIAYPEEDARLRSVYLRKTFRVDQPIRKARLYATGLGNYVAFLNGERVGDLLLTPGWTDYPQKVQYQTYDVTEQIRQGANALGAILGNMWWSSGLGWQGDARYSEGPLRLKAQLLLEYEDGSTEVIATDDSWKGDLSPITENSLYHGETYDARLEQTGWDQGSFDDSSWTAVTVLPGEGRRLVAQAAPPIRVMRELQPKSITATGSDSYVLDFGQNMVGWVKIHVSGHAGDTVTLRFAELLNEEGNIAQENLRSARATDRYIPKGEEEESWHPYFTYHGFRYVEVAGFPGEPKPENFSGQVIYSSAPFSGHFSSSNELLNRIQENITWGQRGNMHSVPTDCPQRDERLGWMGDAQVFAPTACYNMHMARFFAKWMRDIVDSQDEDGHVHDVNPAIVVDGPASPGWGDAVTVVPWVVYQFYGDKRIIEENYEAMRKWVDYMHNQSKGYLYIYAQGDHKGYGDWIAPVNSPQEPIGAAYFYYSTKLLADMAERIGRTEDMRKYRALQENIGDVFNQTYFKPDSNTYEGGTQTANLLPLVFGITEPEHRPAVIETIAADVKARDMHPSTGFLGTAALLPVLSENGYHELAYQTATQTTYPSWGYMIEKGATTLWELWNSDQEPPDQMNSRNHFALGVIGEWFFGYLGGIRPDPEHPGFKHSLIAPMPVGDLSSARAELETEYGTLISDWQRDDEAFTLNVTVPTNTSATIRIPKLDNTQPTLQEGETTLFESGQNGAEVPGITFVSDEEDVLVYEVGSGVYSFKVL